MADDYNHSFKDEEIAISKLKVDMSYQRIPNQEFVDELARDWDAIAAELPLISNRGPRTGDEKVDGGHFIVSGQHRTRASKKRGNDKIMVRIIDLTKEEDPAAVEAYYRRKANRGIQDRAIDVFKAKIVEGDPQANAIVKLLEKHHTHVNFDQNLDTGINAVSSLEAIYERDEGSVLGETLELISKVYGPTLTPKNCSANILKGVAWFISCHSFETNRSRLEEKMGGMTTGQLMARAGQMQATMGKSRWINVYIVLVDLYNEKLQRGKLELNFKGAQQTQGRKGERTHRRTGSDS